MEFFLMVASSHEIQENIHENTKNKKMVGWDPCSTLPCPHTKYSKTQIKDLLARQSLAPLRASPLAHPASAEVVRVPRPTRKSTEFTKMEQGFRDEGGY
jgi:hypothetical protein